MNKKFEVRLSVTGASFFWSELPYIGPSIKHNYTGLKNVETHPSWQVQDVLLPLTEREFMRQTLAKAYSWRVAAIRVTIGMPSVKAVKEANRCSTREAMVLINKYVLNNSKVEIREKKDEDSDSG